MMQVERFVGVVVVAVFLCLSAGLAASKAKRKRAYTTKEPKVVKLAEPKVAGPAPSKLQGTIVYDTGVASSFIAADGWSVGNRFNTASGQPVQPAGTVTKVTFYLMIANTTTGWITIWDQVNGTTAPLIQSITYTSFAAGSWHTVAASAHYSGNSFLVGVYNQVTATTSPNGDTPGLDSNTVGGQGHHAMRINWVNTTAGTGFAPISGYNALVRATGNVIYPVELMSYSVE